jgi:histidinol phosphatase-like enzyme (inositol monophosphatase family)
LIRAPVLGFAGGVSDKTLRELLGAAVDVAWHGGRHTLAFYNTRFDIEWKADGSPVTVADREAEARMRDMVARRFPDHEIVGEEGGTTRARSGVRWILDPIDGTRTFVRGVPLYGTLVGVEVDGEPAVGAIYLPALDEMIAAARGLGCTWNGRPCRVSTCADASRALLVSTDLAMLEARGVARALCAKTGMQRTWGDCYSYALVATGRADVAVDPVMHIWDCAALLPVLEEAGGRFTDWRGRRTIDGGDAVATNGHLHDAMVSLLRDAP